MVEGGRFDACFAQQPGGVAAQVGDQFPVATQGLGMDHGGHVPPPICRQTSKDAPAEVVDDNAPVVQVVTRILTQLRIAHPTCTSNLLQDVVRVRFRMNKPR